MALWSASIVLARVDSWAWWLEAAAGVGGVGAARSVSSCAGGGEGQPTRRKEPWWTMANEAHLLHVCFCPALELVDLVRIGAIRGSRQRLQCFLIGCRQIQLLGGVERVGGAGEGRDSEHQSDRGEDSVLHWLKSMLARAGVCAPTTMVLRFSPSCG